MKLSGTAALYKQREELQKALAVTDKQIALAEGIDPTVLPLKKTKTRKPRTPKALPYDGVIGSAKFADGTERLMAAGKANGMGVEN